MNIKKSYLTLFLCALIYVGLPLTETNAENDTPIDISIGTIRTEAEKAALGILISYAEYNEVSMWP